MSQGKSPGRLLPTLPGKVRGIVGIDDSKRRTVYSLQCERCFKIEETDFLVLMKTHFHAGDPGVRTCEQCRTGCDCTTCRDSSYGG